MNQHHRCLICLGSNHNGVAHLKSAEQELEKISSGIHWGNAVETAAEDTASSGSYLNRAALMNTTLSKEKLIEKFKKIESRHGRTATGKQQGIVPLDIDLLTYDGEIVKPADLKKSYVQQALQSIVQ